MNELQGTGPDYGAGRKKLGMYLLGTSLCTILTLVAFGLVIYPSFSTGTSFLLIYLAALSQFLVQVFCFLRLTTETEQGVNNILSFIFTIVILIAVIAGSCWIMWNLNYYMAG